MTGSAPARSMLVSVAGAGVWRPLQAPAWPSILLAPGGWRSWATPESGASAAGVSEGCGSITPARRGLGQLPRLQLSAMSESAGDTRAYPCISWCNAEQKSVQ